MISDAKAQGGTIGITDSYRSYDEQVDVARRKGLYSQGGLAAKPGTSEHGWGMATDLDLNNKAQAWVRANGEKYGFVENTPREPWHWAYKPKSV
jgi:LAS superfamily LD-carboxypeptidase LdcB